MNKNAITQRDPGDSIVLYFDGVCYLCNSFINFLIRIDSKKKLKFSAIQSNYAKRHLFDLHPELENYDSIILLKKSVHYVRSDAVIEIIKELRWYWRILLIVKLIPDKLRDRIYDIIAKNRYSWFGEREKCMVPNEDVKSRFLID